MRISYELDLNRFETWSGATDTIDKIKEFGLIDELEMLLEDIFPDGASKTEINDMLWFESEYIFECLGISEEEEEEEEC